LKLDVFTLFPEAFDWFRSQRPVRNAVDAGSELRLFNYRDSTPLGAGQVDDAPYGGGAGMVLRVDVVDAALEAAYADGGRPRIVVLGVVIGLVAGGGIEHLPQLCLPPGVGLVGHGPQFPGQMFQP